MMQDHPSTLADVPARKHIGMHWRKGEAPTLPFFKIKI